MSATFKILPTIGQERTMVTWTASTASQKIFPKSTCRKEDINNRNTNRTYERDALTHLTMKKKFQE